MEAIGEVGADDTHLLSVVELHLRGTHCNTRNMMTWELSGWRHGTGGKLATYFFAPCRPPCTSSCDRTCTECAFSCWSRSLRGCDTWSWSCRSIAERTSTKTTTVTVTTLLTLTIQPSNVGVIWAYKRRMSETKTLIDSTTSLYARFDWLKPMCDVSV